MARTTTNSPTNRARDDGVAKGAERLVLNRLFTKQSSTPETTVSEIPANYDETDVQYVDCRELDEWNAGHMPGSVHIPLGQMAFRKGELDPAKPVVVVCRSGNRSLTGGEILLNGGFTDVKSLAGGLIAWAQAGRPLER